MADLGAAGARNAVILSSGFAETGDDGAAQQRKLAELARRFNISVLGPNCLGFVNFLDAVPLWTGSFRSPSRPGPISVISQSGATGAFITALAQQQEIGLSHLISTGNEADLDGAAFVEHLLEDERVRAVAMFIELIRDPHRFAAAAQKARAVGKPIVVLKIGLSDVTARSAQAHTGSVVGDDRVFEGACRQFGVVRVNSIEDLLFTADVIARHRGYWRKRRWPGFRLRRRLRNRSRSAAGRGGSAAGPAGAHENSVARRAAKLRHAA